MRSVDFGLGSELKSHGGYILDICQEKGKSMSRKMTFFLGFIVLLLFISTPLLVFAQQTAEMQQAHNDAVRDAKKYISFPAWFAFGLTCSLPGVVYLSYATPEIPVGVLIGKSPTYVETYTRVYRDRASEKLSLAAGIGCVTSGAVCFSVVYVYTKFIFAFTPD